MKILWAHFAKYSRDESKLSKTPKQKNVDFQTRSRVKLIYKLFAESVTQSNESKALITCTWQKIIIKKKWEKLWNHATWDFPWIFIMKTQTFSVYLVHCLGNPGQCLNNLTLCHMSSSISIFKREMNRIYKN